MSASALLQLTGSIDGIPGGLSQIGPLQATSSNANGEEQWIELANGDNTITTPTSPTTSGCVTVLPAANTSLVTLKGTGTDTGVPLGKTGFHLWNWGAGNAPVNFVLNSAAAQTGKPTRIIFF